MQYYSLCFDGLSATIKILISEIRRPDRDLNIKELNLLQRNVSFAGIFNDVFPTTCLK